ncbi:Lrp/AsnC family transcriptional regulator [Chloroflexota bacterium]
MIDSLDRRLVDLLRQDASIPSTKLAKQLSVSSSTLRRRVRRLIKEKLIRIVAIPAPETVSLPLRVIVAFQVAHEQLRSIIKQLSSQSNTRFIAATSGRFDIIASMWFESTDHLYNYLENEVPDIEGIRNTETFICLHVEKSL